MNRHRRFLPFVFPRAATLLFLLSSFLVAMAVAQEQHSAQSQGSNSQSTQQKAEKKPITQQPQPGDDKSFNFGKQLAKESREAAGEDETAEFKQSPSVRFLARITGMSLQHAFILAVFLNFAVVAVLIFWAGKKFLPGMFRNRTTAIQKAMEEARKASAEANRRLSQIEARLARLDFEIGAMRAAADKEAEAEEARIRAAAEDDARKIIESAEQEIAAAVKQARRELAVYAADLSISAAQKAIRVDSATDQALVRTFAEQLPTANSNGDGSKKDGH
jgi:F-type H+-transporting ATPase subunit b